MHLEYFQLIDRILDLNTVEKTITVEAQVPTQNTIFEGHFPGYPIMPGVLLIESMAQTSGWLLVALMKFERMPFLAAVKEAKMRGFVTPGELLTVEASLVQPIVQKPKLYVAALVVDAFAERQRLAGQHREGAARGTPMRWPVVGADVDLDEVRAFIAKLDALVGCVARDAAAQRLAKRVVDDGVRIAAHDAGEDAHCNGLNISRPPAAPHDGGDCAASGGRSEAAAASTA